MKRVLWIIGASIALSGLVWVCWPEDEAITPPSVTAAKADAEPPARSLAEQLEDAERELDVSDAGHGEVVGTIVDDNGQPIAGAQVRVFQAGGHALEGATCPVCSSPVLECSNIHTAHDVLEIVRSGKGLARQLAETTSAADGTFRFEDLPQNELMISARKGSLAARTIYDPEQETVLQLFPDAKLSLTAVRHPVQLDGPAVPFAGARATAFSLDSFRVMEAVSDAAGELRLDGLDEGNGVWVLIEAPGLQPYLGTVYSDQEATQVDLFPSRSLLVRTMVGGQAVEATVTVVPGTGTHPVKLATRNGLARFDGLFDGPCDVSAITETMVAPSQTVSLDQELTTVDLDLRAAARLLVTVIDEMGEPVETAEVTAAGQAGDYHSGTSTGGSLVELGPLAEGPITIDVNTDDFRPWHREIDLHPGENTLEVVVKKGVKLTGKVVDADGNPVGEAEVQARAPVSAPAMVYSEGDGSFELTFDEPGPQELTALLNAIGRTTVTFNVPADGVVIRLEARARVKVVVHDGRDPVVGAVVMVNPVNGDELGFNNRTDESGSAVISGLETASYRVMVQAPDFRQPPQVTVQLTEGRIVTVDVAVDRGLSVSGVVVDARGNPVPAADVTTEPWTTNAQTDETGHFTLTTLDPDAEYSVLAATELDASMPQRIKGPQQPLKLVVMPRPVVSGRVVDAATDAPVTEFEVNYAPVQAADGRFSVPISAEGEQVSIDIAATGYETQTWEGARAASRDIGTIRLKKARQIEGIVRDVRGNPVGGAIVMTDISDGEVTSAGDGRFKLALAVPVFEAQAKLIAQRGQQKGSASINLQGVTEIILSPPTKVLGRVLDANGRPVQGVVSLREASGADELQADAAADGSFSLDVAQGRWVFTTRVSASGQTFNVAGATMQVVLGVPPGSCSMTIEVASLPDEVMLLPGSQAPAQDASFEQLANVEGAVLFDTYSGSRLLRAAGFRCGLYLLVARWEGAQRVQQVEVRSGGNNDVRLTSPSELAAAGPDKTAVPH
jgi:protocatechuate 3,4-dioxygenase beta subunit